MENVCKSFGNKLAVDHVNFEVESGTVFGLLGPNGAGKTTLVRMLSTLLSIDSGRAVVAGFDLALQPNKVRSSIGLSGQFAAVDEVLTGFENLEMVAMLYGMRRRFAKLRAAELLETFDLVDAANRPAKSYSGGMRRRLDLAATLVANPPILFLDEPTTGLDPRSRAGLWENIEILVSNGTTIMLTTQYLEEADRLASVVGLIDHGKLVKLGTPNDLKRDIGGEFVRVTLVNESDAHLAISVMGSIAVGLVGKDPMDGSIKGLVDKGTESLLDVIKGLGEVGIQIDEIGLVKPKLDDVFLRLTGASSDG